MSDKKILVGDMSRETAIGILKLMLEAMEVYDSIAPTPQRRNAVQMAISSLETDEAYQLEYEQPEISKGLFEQMLKELGYEFGEKIEPTTKNDLGVDAVSRKELLKIYEDRFSELQKLKHLKDNKGVEDRQMGVNYCINILKELPSVTPQEPQSFRWCTDCREYDQEKHCCHRYSKVIRDTVEEMKQEYIDREVMNKIRAEILEYIDDLDIATEICNIFDKYKAESEQ